MLGFNYAHYVPIIRGKAAEWGALAETQSEIRSSITPLIEICYGDLRLGTPCDSGNAVNYLEGIVDQIHKISWYKPIFIDLHIAMQRMTVSNGKHPIDIVGQYIRSQPNMFYNIQPVFVTGLDKIRDADYQAAIRRAIQEDNLGVCIRVHSDQLAGFGSRIGALLGSLGVKPEQVDLIVDYKLLSSFSLPNCVNHINAIPYIEKWRSLTISSGNFPVDLSGYDKNDQYTLERLDWGLWEETVRSQSILRRPAFSDYTIQHPIYILPPDNPNGSASIRYAAEGYWVIMRGEGVLNEDSSGFHQYPAQALMLRERPEFKGPEFSAGDKYIYHMADEIERTGNRITWLQAGINHHIALTDYQIKQIQKGLLE